MMAPTRLGSIARLASPLLVAGCGVLGSGASVRGGDPTEPGQEPAGRAVASWVSADCRDASGVAWQRSTRVSLVEGEQRQRFVVESMAGTDALVVVNQRQEGAELVFQAVVADGNGHRTLHDLRVPAGLSGDGRMALAGAFTESEDGNGRLVAQVTSPALACRLAPEVAR